jgi:hypothetical protein
MLDARLPIGLGNMKNHDLVSYRGSYAATFPIMWAA